MGKGTVTASGNYAMRAQEDKTYIINAVFKDAEIASEIFSGRINGTAGIIPQRYFIRTDTEEGIRRGGIGYRPHIQADIRLDDVLVNMPTIPELSEGSSNYGLRIFTFTTNICTICGFPEDCMLPAVQCILI